MTILSITEYANCAEDANGNPISAPKDPPLAYDDVAIAGTSARSASFNLATRFILIHTDVECFVSVGPATQVANKTGGSRTSMLGAGESQFRGVTAGADHEIAVIDNL